MKNNCLTIIGTQFGDEGKGKFTEILADKYDYIVRYQGGDNAGHSIQIKNKRYSLRLIPSGIFYKNKTSIIGNGVVINIQTLLDEINYLKKNKIQIKNLYISDRAHVIMDYHILMDVINEKLKGKNSIGTTKRGIGPCYSDKINRVGIRISDLFNLNSLTKKIQIALLDKNILFEHFNESKFEAKILAEKYFKLGQKIKKFVADTNMILNQAIEKNEKILFEGAQGGMLDLDFGTYPYVTSSNPLTSAYTGSGLEFNRINSVLGIVKAYLSRVGSGPMPTELDNKIGEEIRSIGNEFGTVTKRPRRIGWIDLVALKHTIKISGCKFIAITLLDVLDTQKNIKACIGYKLNNKKIDFVPSNNDEYSKCVPIYKTFKGWLEPIKKITSYNDLPNKCKEYLSFIESFLNVKIAFISVGANKNQTIKVGNNNDF
ncbi:adenylosuccinate synthase [Mycoplasmoides alvi]|uniref:adenylosuccinate synthase n=1 Tax=Mycoplasmoides alvi TaxID=78580 RepID=UPI00051C43F5|nr:adenylosuccinate synthase [Mycoplasmoides alvi]